MTSPFFSIIIPTYNRGYLIQGAIRSVVCQDFTNWELIIVDDGSTDNTRNVVLSFNESKIKYIYQDNEERSAARNNGISNALGEYVCFLDSDDCYLPNHLSTLYEKIKNVKEKKAFFYTGRMYERPDGKIEKCKLWSKKESHPVIFFWNELLQLNSACIYRPFLKDCKFDERYNIWEDNHFALRLLSKYPFHQINEYTTILKYHENRGVEESFKNVSLNTIKCYVECISDLFNSHYDIISKHLTYFDLQMYIDAKLNMFLYKARENKQFRTAYVIALKSISNRFTYYNVIQLLKIPIKQILSFY